MAKALQFVIGGKTYDTSPIKVERKKIYGYTEIKATAPDGTECSGALLDGNGMTIIPKGAVKLVTTNEAGEWVERTDFVARNEDGSEVVPVASSFDAPLELDKECSEEDLLDCMVKSVYQLTGEGVESLKEAIGEKIFTFPFSYRGGNSADDAFILSSPAGLFVIVGERTEFDMIGLAEQAMLDNDEEESEEESDDLDFGMF